MPAGSATSLANERFVNLGTTAESNLTRCASRHARRLQWAIAGVIVAFTWITQLAIQVADSIDSLGFSASDVAPAPFAGLGALISMFASWSSVWVVLGCGRWWVRVAITLGIFHGVVVVGLAIAAALGEVNTGDLHWRELLAMVSASSYALSAQVLFYAFFVWLFKAFGFRLLYFDDAAVYPHPRKNCHDVSIAERPATTLLHGRTSIADIFVLTTWVAVYLAAWYPIVNIALQDSSMFGASFVFVIILFLFGFNAAVALPVMLLPGMLAMLDRRGKLFQIVCHSIVFIIAVATLAVLLALQLIEDEGITMTAVAVIAFFLFEGLLYFVMRKPTKWFRFRLVRLRK